jgi:REP element-mobilizing transposase RayT
VAVDRILDMATSGPFFLRMPQVARVVQEAIVYRDGREYELHAFVVMPNHVHVLVTPTCDLPGIMQSLKRFTAREANKILGLTGHAFWQDENYDRFVRNDVEFGRIVSYIEMNPVRAGLCFAPEEFPYSSAGRIANPPQATSLPHIG